MSLTIVLGVLALVGDPSHRGDGSRFRGPRGDGVTEGPSHPSVWGADQNLAWNVRVPGAGWSAPVVRGDQVLVTTAISAEAPKPRGFTQGVADPRSFGASGKLPDEKVSFQLRAYRLGDGELLWIKTLAIERPAQPTHPSNTFATETPAVEGDLVFVHFGAIGLLAAVDEGGEERWRKELGAFEMSADFGTGSSLVTRDGLLYVVSDNQEASFLLALDTRTGEERWRAARPVGSAWSTPVVWDRLDRTELVAAGPGAVTSYEPDTGEVLWQLEGVSGSFTASPTWDEDRIVAGNSGPMQRGPLFAIAAGAAGTFSVAQDVPPQVEWYTRGEGPGFSSPCVVDGRVYVVASGGFLTCFDAQTGTRIYKERLPNGTTIAASLWSTDDELYVLNEAGETFGIALGDEYRHLCTNTLDDLFWSTPTVVDGSLLMRGAERLYCVRGETLPSSDGR